jgi:uroporphyrinogen-III decarboxylase
VIVGVEESKKGFEVEIGAVRAELGPDICMLGNVDSYGVVELGDVEIWEAEIERQIRAAGPEKFIVSCGSPTTFDTPPEQLREFIQAGKRVRDRLFTPA